MNCFRFRLSVFLCFYCGQFICLRFNIILSFVYFLLCYCLVVSTSAIDCLERLVPEMTYYVSSGMFNPTHFSHLYEQFLQMNLLV